MCAILGCAALVCLLAAVLCGSPVTVFFISDFYCWWAFVTISAERRKDQRITADAY